MDEIKTTPTYKLVGEMAHLEQEINLKLIRYEKIRQELCDRFPTLNNEEEFKPKILVKKGNN